MFILKTFSFIIAFLILTTGIANAQIRVITPAPNSSKAVTAESHFVSPEAGFTIALPANLSASRPNQLTPGVHRSGTQYTWNLPEGLFMVSFFEGVAVPENPQAALERMGAVLIEGVTGDGGSLIGKKALSLDGHAGLEIRMRLKIGTTAVVRYYAVKNLTYALTAGWGADDSGEFQLEILDTFKLIGSKAVPPK